MEKAEKKSRKAPRKPPIAAIKLMPKSLASLFIAASVGRLSHLFPRWMSSKIETKHNITSSQLMALFILSQSEEVTMGQLAQMLDLTPRAITGLMSGLESKSYILREKDRNDQRVTWLRLSASGKNFMKATRPDVSAQFIELFKVLSKNEQVELVRIIEKLTDHMKTKIDES